MRSEHSNVGLSSFAESPEMGITVPTAAAAPFPPYQLPECLFQDPDLPWKWTSACSEVHNALQTELPVRDGTFSGGA